MKKNPKVFIYLQSYSCENYIRRALDSILNQTYQNWICIICDNGAKDSTPQIIKEYQKKDILMIRTCKKIFSVIN